MRGLRYLLPSSLLLALAAAAIHCGKSTETSASADAGTSPANDGAPNGATPDGSSGTCTDASALRGDIVNACGTIDPKAYAAMAPALGTAAGIAYRYGAACDRSTLDPFPTWSEPTEKHFDNSGNGSGWNYEVGGPESAQGQIDDYSDNMGQGIYVADGTSDPGVVDLTTITQGRNTFAESPQLPWQYYGGGSPAVSIVDYNKAGAMLSAPIAINRCYGNFDWCESSFMAFPNGAIVTGGTYTAHNENTLQLPAEKVPTAISITNSGEFALVTVWDTQNLKGQVAVIALAGMAEGYKPGDAPTDWWGEWAEVYPGLRNLGNVGFMKLLGFVDLPGMMAPTEISASADYVPSLDSEQGWLCTPDGTMCRENPWDLTLSVETNRQSFIGTGPNAKRYAKSGFAVVISKSEKKAIFLDLKPLFAKVQSMYFGTTADFAKTQTVGQMDSQWPYAFSYAPDFAPTIVKTVTLADAPTSVKTSLEVVDRAWVGTIDGTIHIFDVGGYGDNGASPSAVNEVGTVAVGKNPTWIAYEKHEVVWNEPGAEIDKEVIVVSRGECKIDWVKFGADNASGSIVRTLRDSRLIDPIAAEDNDRHSTVANVLTIADYGGKQFTQYRYGPVIFYGGNTTPDGGTFAADGGHIAAACPPPNGCGIPDAGFGDDGGSYPNVFEFGGAYATMGDPFRFTAANTP